MGKHASQLTLEELAGACAAAGEKAAQQARDKGVAVTGYARRSDGQLWLARSLPNGKIEWIEPVAKSAPATEFVWTPEEDKLVG